jgi:hypothetical protein
MVSAPRGRGASLLLEASGLLAAGGFLGGSAAGLGGLVSSIDEASKDKKGLVESLKGVSPVPVVDHPLAQQGGGGAYIQEGTISKADDAKLRSLGMPELGPDEKVLYREGMAGPGIVAHEVGHAGHQRTPLGRLTQSRLARGAFMANTPLALAAGGLAGRYIEDPDTAAAVSAGVPTAIAAPTLVSEGAASLRGLRTLKDVGASPKDLSRARRSMALALGSYGGKGLVGLGAGVGAYGLGRYSRDKI